MSGPIRIIFYTTRGKINGITTNGANIQQLNVMRLAMASVA